jgi:hypothetical protein
MEVIKNVIGKVDRRSVRINERSWLPKRICCFQCHSDKNTHNRGHSCVNWRRERGERVVEGILTCDWDELMKVLMEDWREMGWEWGEKSIES